LRRLFFNMVIFFMINEVQAAINRSNLSSRAKVRLADCLAPLAILANQRLQEDDTAFLTMIAATPDEAAKFGIARWPELPERASLPRRRAAAVALHRGIERAAGEDILLGTAVVLGSAGIADLTASCKSVVAHGNRPLVVVLSTMNGVTCSTLITVVPLSETVH
jgi:hypothetical protein